jgi:hypothetical protein
MGTTINLVFDAMTEEEFEKAKEFHEFLKNISKSNHGYINIRREQFIKLASCLMEVPPIEAYQILKKMKNYGWIIKMEQDFIIVRLD